MIMSRLLQPTMMLLQAACCNHGENGRRVMACQLSMLAVPCLSTTAGQM